MDTDKAPLNVGHKPIVEICEYRNYDGFRANDTDARALSVGIAQWDKKQKEISAKVFRHTGKQWSPQSEEMPLHRCIDLCSLIVQSIRKSQGIDFDNTKMLKPDVVSSKDLHLVKEFYEINKEDLLDRMSDLYSLLKVFLTENKKERSM